MPFNPAAPKSSRGLGWPEFAAWALLCLIWIQALNFQWKLIHFPYPLENSEPAWSLLAHAGAAGADPGALAALPMQANPYGPLYPALCSQLCKLGLACDIQGQRGLAAILILGLAAILAACCMKLGAGGLESACLGVWIHAALLIGLTPASRPDALGCLLCYAGLALPFFFEDAWASLALAALLFSVAVFSKPYFAVGPLLLALRLFLQDRRRFWAFAPMQALALGLSLAWVLKSQPYALYESLLCQLNVVHYDAGHMWRQGLVTAACAAPGALLLGLAAFFRPKDANPRANPWTFYLGASLLCYAWLGCNTGSNITYVIQLVFLPAAPCLAGLLPKSRRWRGLALACLLLNAAAALQFAKSGAYDAGGALEQQWQSAGKILAASKHPYAASDLAGALQARGLKANDSGLSSWFEASTHAEGWKARLFPDTAPLRQRYEAWQEDCRKDLASPGTDYAFVPASSPLYFPDLMQKNFDYLGTISLPYPQTLGATQLGIFRRKKR